MLPETQKIADKVRAALGRSMFTAVSAEHHTMNSVAFDLEAIPAGRKAPITVTVMDPDDGLEDRA